MQSSLSIFSQGGNSDMGIERGSLNGTLPFFLLAPIYYWDGVSLFCHGSLQEFSCSAFAFQYDQQWPESFAFLFCVCTVLHGEILQSYLTISPSRWPAVNEPMDLCQILRNISSEDLLLLIFFQFLISFSFTYASVFLSAARLKTLEGLHQKQQLHNHLQA